MLWQLRKGLAQACAELRQADPYHAEVRFLLPALDRRHVVVCYSTPHVARRIAIEDADRCRLEYEAEGWRGA